jgi:hypothetical protein
MTFEARHQIIKNVRWFNFKNLPLSVMNHLVQDLASRLFLPSGDYRSDVFCPPVNVDSLRRNRASFNGVSYQLGDVLMIFEGGAPHFVQLELIKVEQGHLQLWCSCLRVHLLRECNIFQVNEKKQEDPSLYIASQLIFPWPVLEQYWSDSSDTMWLLHPIALPYKYYCTCQISHCWVNISNLEHAKRLYICHIY